MWLIFINSRARAKYLDKTNPAHYELGVYRPTIQPDDDDDNFPDGYDARDIATSQTGLTEDQGSHWNKLSNGTDGVDDVQTTFVNEEAIYVNSTFRGLMQLIKGLVSMILSLPFLQQFLYSSNSPLLSLSVMVVLTYSFTC